MSLVFLFKRISTLKCPEQATGELNCSALDISWYYFFFLDIVSFAAQAMD